MNHSVTAFGVGAAGTPEIEQVATPRTQYSLRSVERALDMLDLLRSRPAGVKLLEIGTTLGLPKSTAFRYLATLQSRQYVDRDPISGDYHLGPVYAGLTPAQSLAARVRPFLVELQRRFQETVNFGILDRTRILYVEIVESEHAMRLASRVGDRDPLHSTSLGKAVASQLEQSYLRRILISEGMPKLTPETITDLDVYLAEITEVRKRGWALDNGENEIGGRCVATPITDFFVPAAISLSAPSVRVQLDQVEVVARALLSAASRIRSSIATQVSQPGGCQ